MNVSLHPPAHSTPHRFVALRSSPLCYAGYLFVSFFIPRLQPLILVVYGLDLLSLIFWPSIGMSTKVSI